MKSGYQFRIYSRLLEFLTSYKYGLFHLFHWSSPWKFFPFFGFITGHSSLSSEKTQEGKKSAATSTDQIQAALSLLLSLGELVNLSNICPAAFLIYKAPRKCRPLGHLEIKYTWVRPKEWGHRLARILWAWRSQRPCSCVVWRYPSNNMREEWASSNAAFHLSRSCFPNVGLRMGASGTKSHSTILLFKQHDWAPTI